jgi:outer membrane protein insertion porin family
MQITASARLWLAARIDRGLFALRGAMIVGLLAIAGLAAPQMAMAQSYNFSTVNISGNARVDAATILSFAKLPKGKAVTAAALNDAYQRIVASGLFETVELKPQGGALQINVVELPMIDVVDYQGNKRIKDEDLIKIAKSKARLVYSPAQAEADAAAIAEVYRSKGRMAAVVTPRIIRLNDNRVDLVFEIAEGGVAEVQRLNFVGNRDFSDYRLRQVLRTKQAGILHNLIQRDSFDESRLPLDEQMLRDFYQSRGYIDFDILDSTAEYSRDRDATFLTFTISEGRSFKIGKVSTLSEVEGVDAKAFEKIVRLRSGVTYSPSIIDKNTAAMETLASDMGLNFMRIDPRITRNDHDGTLDVTFTLVRGERVFVERIDIEGNTTTLDSVVRRQFRTVEGDPLNPADIRQAANRIRALGFFSDVSVTANPGDGADQTVVKVEVAEQPTGALSFGATYGVASGFGLSIGLTEPNFLGRGQAVDLSLQSGIDSVDSSIDFTDPSFLGRDVAFGFHADYTRTDHNNANYDTSHVGVSPSLTFALNKDTRLKLAYEIGQTDISNVDTPDSSILLQNEEGSRITSSLGYTLSYDSRDDSANAGIGYLLRMGQTVAGLGGDTKYIDSSIQALAQTQILHDEVEIRAIFEGGILQPFGGYDSTVTERHFGNGKMRGFKPFGMGPRDLGATNQDALGGNIYAVAHLETDFPLGLPEEYGISAGAFLDVGSVWGLDNTAGTGGTVDDSFRLRSVVGLSILWKTPIGPLRLDFTRAIKKESYDEEQTFDLTIATKF